jgi:RNA-directed DNA polymerase
VVGFKERVRELTRRDTRVSVERMAEELARYLRGWIGYFGNCETPSLLHSLEEWTRRRLRSALWKQWKRGPYVRTLLQWRRAAHTVRGSWRTVRPSPSHYPTPNFASLGIPLLTVRP